MSEPHQQSEIHLAAVLSSYAHDLSDSGMLEQARPIFYNVLELRRNYPHLSRDITKLEVSNAHKDIADISVRLGSFGEAATHYYQAWLYYITVFGRNHPYSRTLYEKYSQASSQAWQQQAFEDQAGRSTAPTA